MAIELKCHKGNGPAVTGTALGSDDRFSARNDLDVLKGVFRGPSTSLPDRTRSMSFWFW